MIEIQRCDMCGRRPSEASETVRNRAANVTTRCPDPCHDAADLGPAAVALLREWDAAGEYLAWEKRVIALLAAAPEAT